MQPDVLERIQGYFRYLQADFFRLTYGVQQPDLAELRQQAEEGVLLANRLVLSPIIAFGDASSTLQKAITELAPVLEYIDRLNPEIYIHEQRDPQRNYEASFCSLLNLNELAFDEAASFNALFVLKEPLNHPLIEDVQRYWNWMENADTMQILRDEVWHPAFWNCRAKTEELLDNFYNNPFPSFALEKKQQLVRDLTDTLRPLWASEIEVMMERLLAVDKEGFGALFDIAHNMSLLGTSLVRHAAPQDRDIIKKTFDYSYFIQEDYLLDKVRGVAAQMAEHIEHGNKPVWKKAAEDLDIKAANIFYTNTQKLTSISNAIHTLENFVGSRNSMLVTLRSIHDTLENLTKGSSPSA